VYSGRLISQSNWSNYIGLKVLSCLYSRTSLGQRVPLLIESNIVLSGIVIIVQLINEVVYLYINNRA
jgi:hypothetical protein